MNPARFFAGILRASGIFEKRCLHCLSPFDGQPGERLCPQCAPLIAQYSGPACALCGLPSGSIPLNPAPRGLICARCAAEKPAWSSIAYYGIYDGVLKDLLLRFKFDGELRLADFFGDLLFSVSGILPGPDKITAIPQHSSRLRQRGFNQAHEIAKSLGKRAGLPIDAAIIKRIKQGAPQEKLTAAQRKANLAGAFHAESVAGAAVWLVDDILTTGATCNEAAAALFKAGAASVSLLLVARTPI